MMMWCSVVLLAVAVKIFGGSGGGGSGDDTLNSS
jgi:hypothetical protein